MTHRVSTTGVPIPGGRLALNRGPRKALTQTARLPAGRANLFVALLALAGVIIPQEVELSLGAGARFTPGRLVAVLLIVPAVVALFRKGRSFVLCDGLAVTTVAWMILASVSSSGAGAIPTAGGDALDFLGGYLIARAYFFERLALYTFIRVLKIFAIVAIAFGIADSIAGQLITHDVVTAIFGGIQYHGELRNGWVRAASTFPHPILFGIFCALTGAILLFSETSPLRRTVSAGICFLGCLLPLSSAALMTFAIIVAVFTYNQLLMNYWWRWLVLWVIICAFGLVAFVVLPQPLSWVLSHLTLDPQTGFYRIMIWDVAFMYIGQSPIVGYGYQMVGNWILDGTVDSIWLVYSLRFGLPMVILFFWTNTAAVAPQRSSAMVDADPHMDQMRRGFSLVLLMFMFTGITVHFWNYMLTFWGLCLGVRASLRESARAK